MTNVAPRYHTNCESEFCVVRHIHVIPKCTVWDVKDKKKCKIAVNMNSNYSFFTPWTMIW